jgi:hypothetical protein
VTNPIKPEVSSLPAKPKLGKKPKFPAADNDESDEDEINEEGAV